ncbi:MAG TPA: LPD7 domain-containing protein, partial [Gemmatimonadales bacterium]|nr:LPD7 domain-containing protein [Gemmatimonadales bacterium]
TAVLDRDRVHYHLPGSRRAPVFTDRGKTIDIHDGRNREAVLAALQLSAQKWGEFWIRGDAQFKRTCVELAAEHRFNITNPELQQTIAAERERLRLSRSADAIDRPSTSTRQSMTPAAIYQRHFAAVAKEQGNRQADPSRVDAEVAVRLAVTGHSREQIVTAIGAGARAGRASEIRDWDTYARRAADFAFSPPGREMRERLVGHERRLLQLEGRQDEIDLLRKLGGPLRGL